MDDSGLDRLFSGDLNKLSPLAKRVVRLFISSTFTDMTLERNSFMERVYPRLKKYCRERHGLDFQVVDMRWGVRDEATDDHQTVNLCSREIKNCQRMSLGPNFVALLGDKYGFRPLCNKIKSSEYRALRRCLIEQDINTDFLDTWYKEDQNAVPAEYLLQPISSILKNFTNKKEPELQALDQRIWQAIQERLHELLMIGSSRLVKQGRMSEQEQLMKYSISVTEREVIEGCLDLQDAKSHCLIYERSIVDIQVHLEKCLASLSSQLGGSNLSPAPNQGELKSQQQQQHQQQQQQQQQHQFGFGLDRKDSKARKASLKIGNDMISLTTNVAQNAAERRVDKTRRLIGRYIDLNSQDGIWGGDDEARRALSNLKEVKLEGKLRACLRNLTKFKVHWHEQEGVSLKSEEHKHYLNELTEHFHTNMTRMIRRACKSEQANFKSGLIGEVLQHSHYANHVSKTFHGRSEELDKIGKYILSSSTSHVQLGGRQSGAEGGLPMLIYGVGGSGKTSLMARTATLASDWIAAGSLVSSGSSSSQRQGGRVSKSLMADKNYAQEERWDRKACIIMRFCCTTPSSSSMVGVLTSVCRQLQFNFYQYGPLNGTVNRDSSLQPPTSGQVSGGPKWSLNSPNDGQIDGDASEEVNSDEEDEQNLDDSEERGPTRRAKWEAQLAYSSIPEDFVRLVFTFRQLLDNCRHPLHRKRVFVIILDSVERLSSPAESSVEVKYSWLTSITRLPANVRLIVSCSSEGVKSASDESRYDDYRHLKRHFLKAYFRRSRLNRRASSSSSSSSSSSLLSSPTRLDVRSSPVAITNATDSARQIESPSYEDSAASDGQRYHLLQRIIAPVVRLRRAIDKTATSEPAEPQRDHSTRLQLRSSPSRWSFLIKQPVKSRDFIDSSRLSINHQAGNDQDYQIGAGAAHIQRAESNPTSQTGALALDDVHILHVRPMGVELSLSVVQHWLAEVGRNLTKQQWSIVEKSFSSCSRPIFVKLAFGEIVNWKSYSMPSDAKSLTFGSSLLEGNLWQSGKMLRSELFTNDGNLMRLLESSGALSGRRDKQVEGEEEEEVSQELKWQILTMEQQWLNYLDYKQRQQQQNLDEQNNGNGHAKPELGARNQLEQELVIRVGTVQSGGRSDNPNSATGSVSSVSASICHLSSTIDEAICQLFARIELHHGYVLTKHSLSYITAARNGICENELEDLLSLDDVVLDDVFQYHLPPVRRIPPLLWTRIRNDLPDYLSERDADGIVINWHHSQFKQVTQKRYLSDPQQVFYIHSLLADYFLGKWADKAKPFRCTKQQIQMAAEQLESAVQQSIRDSQSIGNPARPSAYASGRLSNGSVKVRSGASFSRLRSSQQDQRLHLMQAKADRRVPHQPLYYAALGARVPNGGASGGGNGSGNGDDVINKSAGSEQNALLVGGSRATGQAGERQLRTRRYNLRKLTELPYHLIKSGRFTDLATNVLFNYKWLYAALDSIGLQSLLADFNEASRALERVLREQLGEESGSAEQATLMRTGGIGQTRSNAINEALDLEWREVSAADELEADELRSMMGQLDVLENTMRLSCSAIQSDTQMLGPQLVGRLLPLIRSRPPVGLNAIGVAPSTPLTPPASPNMRPTRQIKFGEVNYLAQLLEQCDKDACFDCALVPIDHCLQSPDGLQLSSLEGHSFAIMSMAMGADLRHLLAVSNRFIMWDISTGEVSRDIDPKIEGSIMKELKMGYNNEYAIAYTSNNLILVLDILTQQVSKFNKFGLAREDEQIFGLDLVDKLGAREFIVWTSSEWFLIRLITEQHQQQQQQHLQHLDRAAESQQVSIEIVICADLSQLRESKNEHLSRSERILSVHLSNDKLSESYLAFVELEQLPDVGDTSAGNDDLQARGARVSLQTVIARRGGSGCGRLDQSGGLELSCWFERVEASSLALDRNHKQLVYSDCSGNIYLRRRRRLCWSRPKLIARADLEHNSQRFDINKQTEFLDKGNSASHLYELGDLFNSLEADRSRFSAPLAIELDSPGDKLGMLDATEETFSNQLAAFEEQIDAVQANDEIEASCVFANTHSSGPAKDKGEGSSQIQSKGNETGIKLIKLYFSDRIVILKLGSSQSDGEQRKRSLLLPKNIRNISVEPNRCQIKSVILSAAERPTEEYLVAAVGRRLLLYSLYSEQYLRSIDAHTGRIVQLLPILSGTSRQPRGSGGGGTGGAGGNQRADSGRQLCVASASMDKTVKIWNLSNVDKDVHTLDKLDGSIKVLSLASQRPLAACLSRSQLGVYDWRTMKLLARLEQGEQLESTGSEGSLGGGRVQVSSQMIRCKLSSNGRYLALATLDALHLIALAEPEGSTAATAHSRADEFSPFRSPSVQQAASPGGKLLLLRSVFKQALGVRATVRRMHFFAQDSRLLTVLECSSQQQQHQLQQNQVRQTRRSSTTTTSEQTSSLTWRPFRRLLVQCNSIPDGRLQYTIDYSTPSLQSANDSHYLATGGQVAESNAPVGLDRRPSHSSGLQEGGAKARLTTEAGKQASQRVRLPVITRDQLLVVTVELGSGEETNGELEPSASKGARSGRKSSAMIRLATLLKMYSTRDGALMHSINLSQLDVFNAHQVSGGGGGGGGGGGDIKHRRQTNPSLLGNAPVMNKVDQSSSANRQADWSLQVGRSVCISGEQFSRLKPLHYHERSSVVALIDERKGMSFIVDVQAKQLMACLSNWNGKLSSDGRFGLSRMFKAATVGAGLSGRQLGGAATEGGGGGGIELLQMRRATPIKSLLTFKTMSLLSANETSLRQTTGSELDVSCGFTKPNDSYVYFYLAHLRRLLLIRLQDAQLVANYKLASGATKLRCSADGLAIVLALQDGSITSLAIVDPQKNDTLLKLAQYPSRKRS